MVSRQERLIALRKALQYIPDSGMDRIEKAGLSALWRWTVREIEKEDDDPGQ